MIQNDIVLNYIFVEQNQRNMEIKLGSKVKDIVSGFEGIATSEVKYLNGCKQYCVAGKSIEGKEGVNIYFDHAQLEIIDEGINIKTSDTGGPSNYQPKH